MDKDERSRSRDLQSSSSRNRHGHDSRRISEGRRRHRSRSRSHSRSRKEEEHSHRQRDYRDHNRYSHSRPSSSFAKSRGRSPTTNREEGKPKKINGGQPIQPGSSKSSDQQKTLEHNKNGRRAEEHSREAKPRSSKTSRERPKSSSKVAKTSSQQESISPSKKAKKRRHSRTSSSSSSSTSTTSSSSSSDTSDSDHDSDSSSHASADRKHKRRTKSKKKKDKKKKSKKTKKAKAKKMKKKSKKKEGKKSPVKAKTAKTEPEVPPPKKELGPASATTKTSTSSISDAQMKIIKSGPLSSVVTEEVTRSLSKRSIKPMTKEEWEKSQNEIRRVVSPSTGRHRLIRGDGEVLEEIVSRTRHREINRLATIADGHQYQTTGQQKPIFREAKGVNESADNAESKPYRYDCNRPNIILKDALDSPPAISIGLPSSDYCPSYNRKLLYSPTGDARTTIDYRNLKSLTQLVEDKSDDDQIYLLEEIPVRSQITVIFQEGFDDEDIYPPGEEMTYVEQAPPVVQVDSISSNKEVKTSTTKEDENLKDK